ncbi:MAG: hypothetical protein EA406_02475 [Rhodospirillales bacterium]|nr:MAG: hypothetical protein EA406_02475 [Rhodospirillales bacterium]
MLAIASDAERARKLYDDLLGAGVERRLMHVLAKDKSELKRAGLPEPTLMEEAMVTGEGIALMIANMMGTAPPSPKVREHKDDLDAGKILVLFAVPKDQVDAFEALIRRHGADVPAAQGAA